MRQVDSAWLTGQLRFILSFVNHKFAFLTPNYQAAYRLVSRALGITRLYTPSAVYQHWLQGLETNVPVVSGLPDKPRAWVVLNYLDHLELDLESLDKSYLIEDVSLSLGGRWDNRRLGSLGVVTLIQLGDNLDILLSAKPRRLVSSDDKLLYDPNAPVLITTKRFKIREKLSFVLKHQPELRLAENRLKIINRRLAQLGQLIEQLPWLSHYNQLRLRRLYRLPDRPTSRLHPKLTPYVTYIP